MKKTAIWIVVVAVFFASSGPIQACELCDTLRQFGYSNNQIAALIRGSANRAQAEARLRRAIAKGAKNRSLYTSTARPAPVPTENRSPYTATAAEKTVTAQPSLMEGTSSFKFSDEVIVVPPDQERR